MKGRLSSNGTADIVGVARNWADHNYIPNCLLAISFGFNFFAWNPRIGILFTF